MRPVIELLLQYTVKYWNSCLAPELYGLSWLDKNMSRDANTGFLLHDTAHTFIRETTILPRTVAVVEMIGADLKEK